MKSKIRTLETLLLLSLTSADAVSEDLRTRATDEGFAELIGDIGRIREVFTMVMKDLLSEINDVKVMMAGQFVDSCVQAGILSLASCVYVDGESVITDEEIAEVYSLLTVKQGDEPDLAHSTAIATLAHNISDMLHKISNKLVEFPSFDSPDFEHKAMHVGRVISYLHLFDAMYTITCIKIQQQEAAAAEVVEVLAAPEETEIVVNIEDGDTYIEGMEMLLSGEKPSTSRHFYIEGILRANDMVNVLGAEGFTDKVVEAWKRLLAGLKAAMKSLVSMFSKENTGKTARDTEDGINKMTPHDLDKYELDKDKYTASKTWFDSAMKELEGADKLKAYVDSIFSLLKGFDEADKEAFVKDLKRTVDAQKAMLSGLETVQKAGEKFEDEIDQLEMSLSGIRDEEGKKAVGAKIEALKANKATYEDLAKKILTVFTRISKLAGNVKTVLKKKA